VITDLDRLELELRCVPGVVAVGFDRASEQLVVQVVVVAAVSPPDLRSRLRRVVETSVREQVGIEIMVDSLPPPTSPGANSASSPASSSASSSPATPPTPV
jgi:hypothetical protein